MKNVKFSKKMLFVLFIALVFSQVTVMGGIILPESSLWQGGRYYNEGGVYAYIEYAVYDAASDDYHNEFDGLVDGFVNPGSGQYIYAYQIFNLGSDLSPITTFEILGGDSALADGLGYQDDGEDGLAAYNDGASFVWTFETGLFVAYEHSAFIVFSSMSGPVEGSFTIASLDEYGDEPPVTGTDSGDDTVTTESIPEPATLVLLSLGGILFRGRKK